MVSMCAILLAGSLRSVMAPHRLALEVRSGSSSMRRFRTKTALPEDRNYPLAGLAGQRSCRAFAFEVVWPFPSCPHAYLPAEVKNKAGMLPFSALCYTPGIGTTEPPGHRCSPGTLHATFLLHLGECRVGNREKELWRRGDVPRPLVPESGDFAAVPWNPRQRPCYLPKRDVRHANWAEPPAVRQACVAGVHVGNACGRADRNRHLFPAFRRGRTRMRPCSAVPKVTFTGPPTRAARQTRA